MPKKRSQKLLIVIFGLSALCLCVLLYQQHVRALDRELAAKQVLAEINALVVLDGAQQHVASLNLTTLQSRADLEKALEVIPDLLWLGSLDASRTLLCDDDLAAIAQLEDLKSLAISDTDTGDEGVAHLESLSQLNTLNLTNTNISSEALRSVARLRDLKILNLTGTKVNGPLDPLAQLPHLEWLVLRSLALDENALAGLASCTALHRMSLEESSFSEQSLKSLLASAKTLAVDK